MDYQEVIRDIQFLARRYDDLPDVNYSVSRESLDIAILSMLELQKYRALGTLEEVRDAVEKQKAKKPNWHINPIMEKGKLPVCPTCNTIMVRTEILGRTIDEHCVMCGQFIDWS